MQNHCDSRTARFSTSPLNSPLTGSKTCGTKTWMFLFSQIPIKVYIMYNNIGLKLKISSNFWPMSSNLGFPVIICVDK